jgi:hypothetical protein
LLEAAAPLLEICASFAAMTVETVQLEHVPATHTVFASFFRNVDNAGFLQSQLLARNGEFEYAFIDASSVSFGVGRYSGPVSRLSPAQSLLLPLLIRRPCSPNRSCPDSKFSPRPSRP